MIWTALIWLKIGSNGGLLRSRSELNAFMKRTS